jgi:hypothetical protein
MSHNFVLATYSAISILKYKSHTTNFMVFLPSARTLTLLTTALNFFLQKEMSGTLYDFVLQAGSIVVLLNLSLHMSYQNCSTLQGLGFS